MLALLYGCVTCFDVCLVFCVPQIKRIHEYKRQYMNVLSIIWRYKQLKKMTPEERKKVVPRVCMFGGKAASGAALTGQPRLHMAAGASASSCLPARCAAQSQQLCFARCVLARGAAWCASTTPSVVLHSFQRQP